MTQYFAATYDTDDNFRVSQVRHIFGASNTYRNFVPRFMELRPGDIILIRKKTGIGPLRFLGHCVVTDNPYQCGAEDPLIWPDEQRSHRIVYPFRVSVDFDDIPDLDGLYSNDWDDWLALGWRGVRGRPINTRQKLSLLFRGNFLPPPAARSQAELQRFERFLSRGRGRRRRTDEIGEAGERHVLELLQQEFAGQAAQVIWRSRIAPQAPYDIEVTEGDTILLYVEVKATTQAADPGVGWISARELDFRQRHREYHRLYFVVFRGSIHDPAPETRLLADGDFQTVATRYQMNVPLRGPVIA